jgi:GNAT superfamily N-acetyltransferase
LRAVVSIRTGVAGDLDALRGVYRRASLSNAGDRAALLAHPEVLVWPGDGLAAGWTRVAADGAAVVGFATLAPAGTGVTLSDLFVEPDRMRQGIGRLLVEDALARAWDAGATHVEVTANPHALAFYRAVGFAETGTTRTPFGPAPTMRHVLRG